MGDIKASGFGGIPYGNNAGRPSSPEIGRLYSNGEESRLELYTSNGWSNIVQEVPGVSGITGLYNQSVGSGVITISGSNFSSGSIVYAVGTNGSEVQASTVVFTSIVQLVATFTGLDASYEPYDIKVVNPSNLFGILPDSLYINQTPVWNTSSGSIGVVTEDKIISLSVSATDPEGTSISYSSSNLPEWLSINSSTGALTGTSPLLTSDTTYSFTVSASDGVNTSSRNFSVTVNANPPIWTTSSPLTAFTKNTPYSITLEAIDNSNVTPTFSIASGSLPAGLSLSSFGVISGTPVSSVGSTLTIRATDNNYGYADRVFSIPNISPTWITSSGNLSAFSKNISYSTTLSATDDGTVAYSIVSGSLPTGLSLNSSTGVILGTPSGSTSQTFTIRATDDSGNTADREFTIPNTGPVWSTSGTLSAYGPSSSYSVQLSATDDSGVAPTYSLASGSLPSGLSLSSSGLISGSSYSGNFSGNVNIVVSATDENGLSTNSGTLTIPTSFLSVGSTFTINPTHGTTQSPPTLAEAQNGLPGWASSNISISNNSILLTNLPTGTYTVTCAGARGGSASTAGGQGATITSSFTFASTPSLYFMVGKKGDNDTNTGGGGGGTGIWQAGPTLLIAAGGGGGGTNGTNTGGNGQTSTSGQSGRTSGGAGGSSGNGGGFSQSGGNGGASAGGGWLTAGASSGGGQGGSGGGAGSSTGSGGKSYYNGYGGYGLGGGGGNGNYGGGGGGGYSGGGGGQSNDNAGGGGGSYSSQTITGTGLSSSNDGYITFTKTA